MDRIEIFHNFTRVLLWLTLRHCILTTLTIEYYSMNRDLIFKWTTLCDLALLCSFCSYFTLSFDAAISCCDTWTYISIQVIRLMKSRFAFLCMYVMFNVAVLCCNLAFNWQKKKAKRRVIFPTSDEGRSVLWYIKNEWKIHERAFDVGRTVSANIGHVS